VPYKKVVLSLLGGLGGSKILGGSKNLGGETKKFHLRRAKILLKSLGGDPPPPSKDNAIKRAPLGQTPASRKFVKIPKSKTKKSFLKTKAKKENGEHIYIYRYIYHAVDFTDYYLCTKFVVSCQSNLNFP
jgi:hypothetical protein